MTRRFLSLSLIKAEESFPHLLNRLRRHNIFDQGTMGILQKTKVAMAIV
jgi:hypothetical protein